MIIAPDVMPLLLHVCPSFQEQWITTKSENPDSPAGRLTYIDAGAFVRHLVALRLAHTTDEFPAVFDTIERLITEGDDFVRDLAVIGYLEGLQMRTVTDAGLDPERDFRPWLRSASERHWAHLNESWGGPATLAIAEAE
jgi:hypothetical protein